MSTKKGPGSDQDKPKLLQFKGKTYTLPDTADDWDLETAEAFERDQYVIAVSGILGTDQWRQIKASGAKMRDLQEIVDQISKAYGFLDTGESNASTD